MSALTHHLVRKGLEVTSEHLAAPNDGDHASPIKHIDALPLVILVLTAFAFAFGLFVINYSFGAVVATLAAIEDPQPAVYVPIDDPHADPNTKQPETALEQSAPVTSSLRRTIRHLRASPGGYAYFRGRSLFVVLIFARSILTGILTGGQATKLGLFSSLAHIAVDVALATVEMGWIHSVISQSSGKRFWNRIPSLRTWPKIAPVVALRSVASQISLVLPAHLALKLIVWPLSQNNSMADPEYNPAADLAKTFGISLLSIGLALLVEVPASVTLIRVAASMLPEEDETVVPFDRSFDGKIQPAVLGGSGKIGMLDAWKTFKWPSRIRLLKLLVKVFGLNIGLGFVFGLIFGAEIGFFGLANKIFNGQ
ncbi:hypothetical protein FQN53_005002 [Emmonsiellopsis sp. PD_33]|nr:hypothetical protein FQN53_005002 [Emmonsiellopsis sp. PD_33]